MEIGIRKILGASVMQIFVMVNGQFMKLGIIGLILSIPIAWSSMQQLLENFTVHVEMNIFVFLISGILVMALAGISVAYLSISAASIKPAEVLKDE